MRKKQLRMLFLDGQHLTIRNIHNKGKLISKNAIIGTIIHLRVISEQISDKSMCKKQLRMLFLD